LAKAATRETSPDTKAVIAEAKARTAKSKKTTAKAKAAKPKASNGKTAKSAATTSAASESVVRNKRRRLPFGLIFPLASEAFQCITSRN